MATRYLLYIRPTCLYCQDVLSFMDEHGISIPTVNISKDAEALETLRTVGGKVQVPCLFIDGEPMYESQDIIRYLDRTFP